MKQKQKRKIPYAFIFIVGAIVVLLLLLLSRSVKPLSQASPESSSQVISESENDELGQPPGELPLMTPEPVLPSIEVSAPQKIETPIALSQDEIDEIRAEAKANLSSLFTSQRAFFAEFDRYSTDLMALGWRPTTTQIPFKAGFLRPYEAVEQIEAPGLVEDPTRTTTDAFLDSIDEGSTKYTYAKPAEGIDLSAFESLCQYRCSVSQVGFEAMLVTPLGNSGRVDVWIVNEKKEITLVKDGLLER